MANELRNAPKLLLSTAISLHIVATIVLWLPLDQELTNVAWNSI